MLITRREIFENKKKIGSEIAKLQKFFFDEEVLQEYKDEGQEPDYWEIFDGVQNEVIACKTFDKVISLNYPDLKLFTKVLTKKLTALFTAIGVSELYVVSYLKRDFFGDRTNRYKPLVKAYEKLETITGSKSYNEAFSFGVDDLADFADLLFWISRCDPGVSDYLFLTDQQEKIMLFICKYGNVHVTELDNEQLTEPVLASMGWTIIDGPEEDNFSEGSIKGRRIKL